MAHKAKSTWHLRAWRKHRGYTQGRLAEMTSLSVPYISQLERGERQYTQELLELFAEALSCDVPDLIVRDPTDPVGIWSVWDKLRPASQRQLVEIGETLAKTGTEG